jgi:hypothetical protein
VIFKNSIATLAAAVCLLTATAFSSPEAQIKVSAADFNKPGSPTAGIQEAIDSLPETGGVVYIPVGTYEINRSINLRSGIRLVGEGDHSIIARRDPCVETKLTAPAVKDKKTFTVESAKGFAVGHEVCVRSDQVYGWGSTHAIITKISGKTITIDRPLKGGSRKGDYLPDENGVVQNFYPAIYALKSENVRVENVKIDGRMEEGSEYEVEFTVSAIHFNGVRDGLVSRVHVKSYPADGVSIQRGDNVTVTQCLSERNLGHGFHPGTSITSGSWTDNVGRYNGWDGLYFCFGVRHSLMQGNRFHNNGWNGIGGLGWGGTGDRYNVVTGNFCSNNAKAGIQCTEGGNNIISNNVCENNSQEEPGKWPGILVQDTHSSVISGNRCLDFQEDDAQTQHVGIQVTGKSRNNVIKGNILSGHKTAGINGEALDNNTLSDNLTLKSHEPAGK